MRLAALNKDDRALTIGPPVVTMDDVLTTAVPAHAATFVADVEAAGIPRDWGLPSPRGNSTLLRRRRARTTGRHATLDKLPVFAHLQLVEKVGVWCDNVGHVTVHVLLPSHCCCHLNTYRTTVFEARAELL